MAREIYFIDGMDLQDYDKSFGQGKYIDISYFNQGVLTSGRNTNAAQGGGQAIKVFNSAFWSLGRTKVLQARNRYVVGFAWLAGVHFVPSLFMRWESQASVAVSIDRFAPNDGTQLSVSQTATGTWEFHTGGRGTSSLPGTFIGASPFAFQPQTWYYVELDVQFGVGGYIKMYVDDVLVYSATSLTVGHTNPDRWTWRWESFGVDGLTMDDLYIANEVLGPCRVTSTWPAGPGPLNQWARTGVWFPLATPSNWEAVSDHWITHGPPTHDSDASYISATHTGHLRDYFTMTPFPCYGRILAVALNAAGRNGLTINAPGVDLILRAKPTDPTETVLAAGQLWRADLAYGIVQAISLENPATGSTWIDKAVNGAFWGVRSAGVGTSRVTQVFLEKLVTLRDVPFNCGQSSYAFGKS